MYGGALGRAARKKTSRNKIGWEETEPTRHFCISRGERFAGTAARRWKFAGGYKLLEAKGKGVKRTRNTSLLIRPSDNGGGRKNLETASLRV